MAGIVTAALVAPGAMSPVSIEPSFSRTRCTSVSAFLNTTSWPPAVAGFGENDCAPFRLVTVIVITLGAGELGAVGLEEVPPPEPPHADIAAKPAARAETVQSLNCI